MSQHFQETVPSDPDGTAAATSMSATPEPAPAEASPRERHTLALLEGVVHRILDDGDAANALAEMAEVLSRLGDTRSALSIAREAFRRHPKAPHLARVYRKMAMRDGRAADVLGALEGEARVAAHPAYRAAIELERGRMLDAAGQPGPAQAAYENALGDHRPAVAALAALERLAVQRKEPARAAELAQRLAAAVTDPALGAEHRGRAARALLRAADPAGARALAAAAASSPSGRAVAAELAAAGAVADLLELRSAELADGSIAAAPGWFDVGVLAWYGAGDLRRALDAFTVAAEYATGASKAAALAELEPLLARGGEWQDLLEVERERLELETQPQRRVVLLTRIATLLEERLGDDAAAADAYERALGEDPSFLPALEGAGRVFTRATSRDRLLRMHELEAKSAGSPSERAHALRRLGVLLLEDPARRDEGVVALRAALEQAPGDPLIVAALQSAFIQAGAWTELLGLHEQELLIATDPGRRGWLLAEIGTVAADRLGQRPRAIAAFREAAKIGAVGPHYVLSRLAQLLEEEGDQAGVAETLARLAEGASDPTQLSSILERQARAYEAMGDNDAALRTYARALDIAPPTHPVTAAAGRAFFRAGRFAELAALFERLAAATTGSERARYLYKAADVTARHLDKPDAALAALDGALALMPDFLPARASMLTILLGQKRWREAGELLAREPEDDVLLLRRAVLAEAATDRTLAIDLYGRAVAAGVVAAAAGFERLLAAAGRWAELAAHYLSGRASLVERDARLRAALILVDHVDDTAAAAAALEPALAAAPDDLVLLGALLPLVSGARTRELLAILAERSPDPAIRYAHRFDLARSLDDAGQAADALAVRQRLLAEQRDPIAEVAVELALEARKDDVGLVAHLRRQAEDPAADPAVLAWAHAAAATRLCDLGRARDAADACDAAAERGLTSVGVALTAWRAARALDDTARRHRALSALADALPAGEERAAAQARLGREREVDDIDGAITAYKSALRAHPLDAAALGGLDRLLTRRGEPEGVIDALGRAFAAEEDPEHRTTLGLALADRLIGAGKLPAANEVLDALASGGGNDLRVLVLAAALHERREAWTELARVYQTIVDRDDVPPDLWFDALWRLITVRAVRLGDLPGARDASAMLRLVERDDLPSWELRLKVLELVDEGAAIADTLRRLAKREDVSEEERGRYTVRLAEVEEDELGDPAAAIETLSSVGSPALRRVVVQKLLALGEKTGRWASAASALEAALDRGGERDGTWEIAIRTRLAHLLEGPLGRPESAVRQYERIVELDPSDIAALERLTALCGRGAPASAIEHHRALLARAPGRLPSYHELRELFLALEHEDGAFCVEAVLVGLGAATEEEEYFYRQRRARLPAEPSGALTAEERAELFPGTDRPAFELLRLLGDHLHQVFPVDFDGYGLGPDAAVGADHPLAVAGAAAAKLFGGGPVRVALVSPRLGPVLEVGEPPLLLLPRGLEDAARREQLHACGELLGRHACGGALGHPKRQGPGGAQILDYVVWAACAAVETSFVPLAKDAAVFRDIRRRIEGACAAVDAAALRAVVAAQLAEAEPVRGDAMMAVFARAAMRAGLLAAQDPAVAVAAQRDSGSDGLDLPHPESLADLAFAVSPGFLAMRKRLGLEVRK